MVRSRLGRTKRNAAFRGSRSEARAPLFFPFTESAAFSSEFGLCVSRSAPERRRSGVCYPAEYRNSRTAQNVFHHCFAQAGSVVIKSEAIRFFVIVKFLKSVRIGEMAQGSELLRTQAILEFVGNGHECHVRDYSIQPRGWPRETRGRKPTGNAAED
jgi:hypothetical protein